MIIVIYPTECALYRGDDVCCRWTIHRFSPSEPSAKTTENGFVLEINPCKPIRIKTHLASLSGDKKWLELSKGKSYDATTILLMARSNRKDLTVVEEEGNS
jgi:hypothetical protein